MEKNLVKMEKNPVCMEKNPVKLEKTMDTFACQVATMLRAGANAGVALAWR
jgi:hypothetical protein